LSDQKSSVKSTLKGIVILILLIVAAGAGGYFFGTYQKFAPIETVPPGTPGAVVQTSTTTITKSAQPSALKNKYWIHTSGSDHVGYSITVFVNGQQAGKFYSPGRNVDVTRFVKTGQNQVTFQAEVLPESMNEYKGSQNPDNYWLTVSVATGERLIDYPTEQAILLNYKRTSREAADNVPYNDTLTFLTLE